MKPQKRIQEVNFLLTAQYNIVIWAKMSRNSYSKKKKIEKERKVSRRTGVKSSTRMRKHG